MTALKTPLRYPGGKSRIVYYLFRKSMIPQSIKEYREGFLGGGSCALAFSTMYPDVPVWVNDLYYNLYIFWTQLQILDLSPAVNHCPCRGFPDLTPDFRLNSRDSRVNRMLGYI